MGELDCIVCLNCGEVGEFYQEAGGGGGGGEVDVDNFKENSNENSWLYLNTCRLGCVLALLSVFSSLCFFLFFF